MKDLEIASYLDRRLADAERERMEDHLAGCAECRADVVEARKLLVEVRRPRRVLVGGGMLAAAAVILLLVRPPITTPRVGEDTTLRATDKTSALVAHGPTGEVTRTGLTFVWSATPGATTYRVTMTGVNGVPLWSASTTDTVLALSDSVRLDTGKVYYWMTDALLGDATTRTTGLREFRLTR